MFGQLETEYKIVGVIDCVPIPEIVLFQILVWNYCMVKCRSVPVNAMHGCSIFEKHFEVSTNSAAEINHAIRTILAVNDFRHIVRIGSPRVLSAPCIEGLLVDVVQFEKSALVPSEQRSLPYPLTILLYLLPFTVWWPKYAQRGFGGVLVNPLLHGIV